ncbi:MAG TPA: pilus assembly protein PilQ [Alphaproteobacteria bacterium]|nr:pilus assembly protein PilQ [Alphaproteobacteria bacterium]
MIKQRINKIVPFLLWSVLVFPIHACKTEGKSGLEYGDRLIEAKPTFDRQKFISESKEKSVTDYSLGPKAIQRDKEESQKFSRTFVNKEESFDYVDAENLEKKSFKVTVNAENMDIRTFSEMLSQVTDVNVLVSDEVKGVVTAKLKDVFWTSMLDSILDTKKLAKYVDVKSNIIRVHDQNTVVQLEEFEQKRKQNVQRALMLKKAAQPLYTEIFKLYYTKPAPVKLTIQEAIGKQAGAEGIRNIDPEMTIDERRNLLIVKARKEDMDLISKLVGELDTQTQQVFIEAFIVEVSDGFEKAFGSRFGVNTTDRYGNTIDGRPGNASLVGVGGDSTGALTAGSAASSLSNLNVLNPTGGIGILTGFGSSADLKIELSALERQGLTKVVSNPRVFTLDNQEAVIFQGDEVPYETTSQDGTKVEFKEAGLRLAVTPSIIGDGNLMLNLTVNKDTVDTTVDNPPITKSELKTNLVTKDGEIVVMGGIYSESKTKTNDKVPGLGDIPGVGKLFSRDTNDSERSELIIFIAPRVLQ